MRITSNSSIKAVIFDWDGTIMDYGCQAPVRSMQEVFRKNGIEIGQDDARSFLIKMGKGSIRDAVRTGHIPRLWKERHGQAPCEKDVSALYVDYQGILADMLPLHTDLLPHVLDTIHELRQRKMRIGITSGYSSRMLEPLIRHASKSGLEVDAVVTPDQVTGGRPHPWMIFEAAARLGVYPQHSIIKVGDTALDILEGLNAGVWTIGVVKGGSELCLGRDDLETMPKDLLEAKIASVRKRHLAEGTNYVINSLWHLSSIIDEINFRLAIGDTPVGRRQGILSSPSCGRGGFDGQSGARLMRGALLSHL